MTKKTIYCLISLIAISCFVYFRWFLFKPSAGGDWHYYNPDSLRDAFLHFTWISSYNLGGVDLVSWRFPIDIFKFLIGFLGFDSSISDKLTVFWPSVIFGNIASFLLVKKILKSNLAAFIGAIVFNFNTYFITTNSAYLIYGATSWVIFSFISFMTLLETRKYKFSIFSALLLFVSASYDFRVAYIGVFLCFLYFVFYLGVINRKHIGSYILSFLFFIFSFGLLSLYWVLFMLKLGSLTTNSILNRTLFGNEFLNVLYSISLYHPFWTGKEPVYFITQQIMPYFWLIPIIAFLGLYLNRKNKNILFFGIIALLGIFLTKQVGVPFSNVYPWLFKYFPGFNAFREASKFYFLIILGYSVLIGAFIDWIWQYKTNDKYKVYARYFLTFFIAIIFLFNVKPIITGEVNGIYVDRSIPNSYQGISQLLEGDNYFRTIWVPTHPKWAFYSNSHPIVGLQNILDTEWEGFIHSESFRNESLGEAMTGFLKRNYSNNLLDMSSVKYVIVPYNDPQGDINIFQYYGEEKSYYINELSKLNYLSKLNIGVNDLAVYENHDYKPHVYLTKEKESIKKSQQYREVDFQFINPTEYKIYLNNINVPVYLNFSDTYHPQWKIRIGNFSWWDALFGNSYFLPDENHFKNDANLNSFYIDPKEACRLYEGCTKNEDGSYDIELTLFFRPQAYMYVGGIISLTTLISMLGYLGYVAVKSVAQRVK